VEKLKFIDLFAGIGGFRIALEKTGYECVYSCEINPKCQEVYFNNFAEKPANDIIEIDINDIPEFDVLTAGFPCQPFSICGKRKGFEDTRGTLFFRVCEIIEAKHPSAIVLENVKYLMHHDQGKTLDVILYSLKDLGYKVNYQLLNAKDFGLPQNRERIIIIATKQKQFNFKKLRRFSPVPKLQDFLCQEGNFEYLDPESYTLIDQPTQQQSRLIFVGYRNNKSIWKKGVRPNTHHLSRVHHQPNRIYSVEGVHPTIPSQETSGRFFIYIPEENVVRKLTIKECYRIMGFPDDFKIHESLGESYKQVGNSVCIPMVAEIAAQLREQIYVSSDEESISELVLEKQEFVQLQISGFSSSSEKKLL
jgi:DNA (cytosine-5)-methyltransferase 1